MGKEKSTSIIVTVSKHQKQALKKLAARKNLKHPDGSETVSSLGRRAIAQFLEQQTNETVKEKSF